MGFYIGCEENWRGGGDWGKKKKGEIVARFKILAYLCHRNKIKRYGSNNV